MIKVGIIGSTGYAGMELVRLLLSHKEVEIVWYGSKTYANKKYYEPIGTMFQLVDHQCVDETIEELSNQVEVIFTATPHGYCASFCNEAILSHTKIIDLSADFRMKEQATYEAWYGQKHPCPWYLLEAVYGLCEINREKIKHARIVANPGCYPTCSILSLYPLIKEGIISTEGIVIDAKSGVSGAGRGENVDHLFCEVNETMKAYGIATHRHTPEIEEQLSQAAKKTVLLNFTPHLVPMARGILTTSYANLIEEVTDDKVRDIYYSYYGKEQFVRFLDPGVYPETRWVKGSNYIDVNVKIDSRTNRIIVMGAMDNLVKGAAGQAVQSMNLMFGFKENMGLNLVPIFP